MEVKTGASQLDRGQIETYLDIARDQGFDAVLTISNELACHPGVHPVEVEKRKIRTVALHHLSWSEIVATAVVQRVHKGVADPDQAWILQELIRYLKHPKSGADQFADMGEHWTALRESVELGTIRMRDAAVAPVLDNWERVLAATCLLFTQELGAEASVTYSKRERDDVKVRREASRAALVDRGLLVGRFKVAGAISELTIEADLKSKRLSISVDIDAPREGRPQTRVNWLLRQLSQAPDSLVVAAWPQGSRTSRSEKLAAIRDQPDSLIDDTKKDIAKFRVTEVSTLGIGRRGGKTSFVEDVVSSAWRFYSGVVQGLAAWVPKAPQAPKGGRSAAEAAGINLVVQGESKSTDSRPIEQAGRQVVDPVHETWPEPSSDVSQWPPTGGAISESAELTSDTEFQSSD